MALLKGQKVQGPGSRVKRWMCFQLSALSFLAFLGCATCPPSPPEDAIIAVPTPFGPQAVKIRKGFFDDRDNWFTIEEWDNLTRNSRTDTRDRSPRGTQNQGFPDTDTDHGHDSKGGSHGLDDRKI